MERMWLDLNDSAQRKCEFRVLLVSILSSGTAKNEVQFAQYRIGRPGELRNLVLLAMTSS